MCAAVSGRVSEVGEAGQSIVTGTGERLNVKWAAGVEEVELNNENRKCEEKQLNIAYCVRLSWLKAALPARWRG